MDFGSEFGAVKNGNAFKHPMVCFCHVGFRTSALLVYLFGGLFSSSFISVFVSVVLLLSIDFWTVKNITGRILVGLRWWNYIDEEGESKWKFESRPASAPNDHNNPLSQTEVRFFWITLVAAPFLWLILFLTAFFSFKFQWLVLVTIGLTLSSSNMLGYLRCKMGGSSEEASVSSMAQSYIQRSMMNNMLSVLTSKITGAASKQDASKNLFAGGDVI